MDTFPHKFKLQIPVYCERRRPKKVVVYSGFFVFPNVLLVLATLKRSRLFPWVLRVKQKALPHLSSLVWSSPCTHFSLPPTEFKLQQLVKEFEERERLQVNNLSSCGSAKSPQLWATFTPRSTALRGGRRGIQMTVPCEPDTELLCVRSAAVL